MKALGRLMSKIFSPLSFSVMLIFSVATLPAYAEIGPKNGDTWTPVLPTKREVKTDDPLVVGDVVVDKSAENSVVARDQAIADARKAAFQKLAERNMTPEELKTFKMPKDRDIAMMVQDFEIKNEQMSSTRYVGNFTVRFRDVVRNYMTIHAVPVTPPVTADAAAATTTVTTTTTTTDDGGVDGATADANAAANPMPADANPKPAMANHIAVATEEDSAPLGRNLLVLPYFENISGETLLWEESNPWLLMWQGALPKTAGGPQITVPLGDISDVAAGSASGVWSGDYKAVERLRSNYSADEVILAVANHSSVNLTIDLYTFNNGHLRRKATLTPYVGEAPDEVVYKKGMTEVLNYLQQPGRIARAPKPVEQISHDLLRQTSELGTTVVDSHSTIVTTQTTMTDHPPLVMKPYGSDVRPAMMENNEAPTVIVEQTQMPPHIPGRPYPILRPGYVPAGNAAVTTASTSSAASGATQVAAQMQFQDPRAWMDLQKRLNSVYPPVRVNITSMSSNSVAFTLSADAPVDAVRQSLSSRGITLGANGDVALNP